MDQAWKTMAYKKYLDKESYICIWEITVRDRVLTVKDEFVCYFFNILYSIPPSWYIDKGMLGVGEKWVSSTIMRTNIH